MTDQGAYSNNRQLTVTTTVAGGREYYILLPTRTNGYQFPFRGGAGYASYTTITQTFQSGFTLYRIDDASDGIAGTVLFNVENV